MARFRVSYVYRRKGNNSGGTQADKTVQAPTASIAVSIVKSEMKMKNNEFFLRKVVKYRY